MATDGLDPRVDRAVATGGPTVLESTFRGTYEGPIDGVPPAGNAVAVPLVSVIEVGDDGIVSWRDYWDQGAFRAQLGLTFPAVVGHLPRFARWTLENRL
jgi:predicted ester cyclase